MNTKQSCLDTINATRSRKAHIPFVELSQRLEDLRRQGRQHSTQAPMDRVAGDLEGLREELRRQMAANLQREFDMLRKDIERAYAASPANGGVAAMAAEFDRLADIVRASVGQGGDEAIDMLRQTLGGMKKLLGSLKGITVADAPRREFFQGRDHDASAAAPETLNRQIDRIAEAVSRLPDADCVRALDKKVHILAVTIENFIGQQDRRDDRTLTLVGERLDEISRAIAAAAEIEPPLFDPAPLERVEACITSLAGQVEELIEDRPEIMGQLSALSQRVDHIATTFEAIHDTLSKIVDWMNALEHSAAAPAAPAAPVMPATAAEPAAMAATQSPGATSLVRAMLAGINRAFSGHDTGSGQDIDASDRPRDRQPSAESGSTAPDYHTVLRRVRGDVTQPPRKFRETA